VSGRRAETRFLLLVVLCAAAGLRLCVLARQFAVEVLQLDFAAYFTAGEAVRLGLDPYRNHPDHVPTVWDGTSAHTHSRFLYPPLVARLFSLAAAVPYAPAKAVFTTLSLGALLAATLMLWRAIPRTAWGPDSPGGAPSLPREGVSRSDRTRTERLLVLLTLLFTAYPVLLLLERGQVDGFTLLLLVLAFRPAIEGRVPGIVSGALVAVATLLKLNAAYFVAFFVLRRFWRGVLGFAAGGAAILALSLLLDGPAVLHRYLTVELPRISRYGEAGTPASRLPEEALARLRGDAPPGYVHRDGRLYRLEGIGFAANASGARVLAQASGLRRPRAALTTLSVILLLGSLGLAAWATRQRAPAAGYEELAFFALALSAVLLAGPLTWAMNVVWLAAGGVLLASAWPASPALERRALGVLALGLLLAWMPDQYAFGLASPPEIGDQKYVAAELLVLLGAGAWLRARTTRPAVT
jgi:hypothetical protein